MDLEITPPVQSGEDSVPALEKLADTQSTLRGAIHGGKWMLFNILLQKSSTFLIFLFLSRLIAPADFGVMAAVLLIIDTVDNLSVISFERAINQKLGDYLHYLNPAWTFNVLRGLTLFLLIFLLAPLFASFFHIRQFVNVIRLGGFFLLLENLTNIGQIFIFKKLDFKKVFIRDAVGQTAQFAVVFGWAFIHPSVYALLAGHIARIGVVTASTYFLDDYRPKFDFNLGKLRDLLDYTKWVSAQGFGSYFMGIMDNTFVARLMGPEALGFYSKALSVSSVGSSPLFQIIYRVGFPAYSRIQDQLTKVRGGFIKSFDLACLISLPFLTFIWIFGTRLVLIAFGARWLPIAAPLKLLTLAATFGAFTNIMFPVFDGLGRPDVRFKLDMIRLGTMTGLLIWLVPRYGVQGAAAAVMIGAACSLIFAVTRLHNILTLAFEDLKPALVSIGFALALVLATILAFRSVIDHTHRNGFVLALTLLSLQYLLMTALIGRQYTVGPYRTIRKIIEYLI